MDLKHYVPLLRENSMHLSSKAIFKKHLATAPPRIASMMLRVQKYDADIKYVEGKNIPLADA